MDAIQLSSQACPLCGKYVRNKLKYLNHVSNCRREAARDETVNTRTTPMYKCVICNTFFRNYLLLENHSAVKHTRITHNKIYSIITQEVQRGHGLRRGNAHLFRSIEAFKGYVRSYRHLCKHGVDSLNLYFLKFGDSIRRIITESITQLKSIKCQLSVKIKFKRFLCKSDTGDLVYEYQEKIVNSNMLNILN